MDRSEPMKENGITNKGKVGISTSTLVPGYRRGEKNRTVEEIKEMTLKKLYGDQKPKIEPKTESKKRGRPKKENDTKQD